VMVLVTPAAAEQFNCMTMQYLVNGQWVYKTVCCNSQGLCY
jgi:hypothetical protein